jgi:hypothetical protein
MQGDAKNNEFYSCSDNELRNKVFLSDVNLFYKIEKELEPGKDHGFRGLVLTRNKYNNINYEKIHLTILKKQKLWWRGGSFLVKNQLIIGESVIAENVGVIKTIDKNMKYGKNSKAVIENALKETRSDIKQKLAFQYCNDNVEDALGKNAYCCSSMSLSYRLANGFVRRKYFFVT